MLTREQVKIARAALNWSADRLAEMAGVNADTIRQYEDGADPIGGTLMKMRRAFEAAGLAFTAEGGVRSKVPDSTPVEFPIS
jgi:transcriptional regulator with XRE-family HTH domain